MNCIKRLIVLIICLTTSVHGFAQWSVLTNRLQRTLLADLMVRQSSIAKDTFSFFGPTFDLQEPVLTKGYSGFDDSCAEWRIPVGCTVPGKNTFLYISCFSDNVSAYTIHITDNKKRSYTKEIKLAAGQYQVPSEIPLQQWTGDTDSIIISHVGITIQRKLPEKKAQFVIGELKLFAHKVQQETAKGYFFYQLTGDSANLSPSFTVTDIGKSYPISSFTIFRDIYAQSFTFRPGKPLPDSILEDSTLALFRFIIEKYPYYKEHRLNREHIFSCLQTTLHAGMAFGEKLRSIDSLISSFSDGHFYIEKHTTPQVSGPVYVKEINGVVQVIAVMDTTLQEKVHLGDRVLAVDGVAVEQYLQTVAARYYGNKEEKQNQAISKMLFKSVQDSTTLELLGPSGRSTITYYYNKRNIIPDNFKPVNRAVCIKDRCFYYRLNKWDVGDWLTFYNHRYELRQCTSVMFDLRGNSGGAEVEAFKMFSCFLQKPVTVSKSQYVFNKSHTATAANVVVPNPYLQLAGKKVVVLVDNNTACAAEIFTSMLQQHARATVIGTGRTAGSYASGDVFYLPFNLVMRVNVLNKFSADNKKHIIEFNGIAPDIRVSLKSYKDLYPYEDKVLQTAYAFLKKAS